jgi:hypothetical protein
MPTLLTKGRTIPCKDNISGVKEFYLFNRTTSQIILNSDNEVIDIQSTFGGPVYLSRYTLKGTSKYSETKNELNKLTYFDQNFNVIFKGIDSSTNELMYELSKMKDIRLIVVLNNSKPILVGKNAGLSIDTALQTIDTTNYNYNFSFLGKEAQQANYLSGYTENNPFAGLTTQPIIITTTEIEIDGDNVLCFLSTTIQTYSGVTLGEGDEFISDDNFYNIDGFLWIGDCVENENEFVIDYYGTGEADLYFTG